VSEYTHPLANLCAFLVHAHLIYVGACFHRMRNCDYLALFNPDSHKVIKALIEPHAAKAPPYTWFQFSRVGYYVVDKESVRNVLLSPIPPGHYSAANTQSLNI
jgi:hypothetical protein